MSTQSSPPPSTADNPFRSVDPKFIRFSSKNNTLRVGASRSVHRGPTLRAATNTNPNAASLLSLDPADIYHIDKDTFNSLVEGTWRATSEATKSQIQNNEPIGGETFAELLTENIEAFANGKPYKQTRASYLSGRTNFNIVATPTAYPVGTVGSLVPVNPGSLEPSVRFEQNGDPKRIGRIDMEIPISFQLSEIDELTGDLRQTAMTPRQDWWASVADGPFFSMRADCEETLCAKLQNPTEDNEAAAVEALKEEAKFIANRLTHYQVDPRQVRPQYPDQQPSESAQSRSKWSFNVPGNPQLNISVTPIPDLYCLPRNSPHTVEIASREAIRRSVNSRTEALRAAGMWGARPI